VTELERKHLVETDRHIAECEAYIAKQRDLIERAIQQGRSDVPILSQSSNQARRGSPITLKLDATARDNQSTQDNEKHNRRDYRPPIIFGAPWIGPPTVVARSSSGFKVSIYHR
jgi:hypothetical protein